MDSITDLPGKQTLDRTTLAGGVKQRDVHVAQTRRIVVLTLWVMGFMLLIAAAVMVHLHAAPWPFDLQTTITLQHLQPHLPSWVSTPIVWASLVDDVLPSLISFSVSFVVLSLIGVVVRRRGGSALPWFVTAIFISLGAGAMNGLDGLIWRYRWLLMPLQLYAVLNILLIGYSRVVEGSHWLTDVLGGYLAGALWLVLLIFLYKWVLDRLTKWHAKRLQEQSLETEHTIEEKFPQAVQTVEKYVKPYGQLLIKCKEDWIHHLAQVLAFSYLAALVPSAILVVGTFGVILGTFDTQVRQILTSYLGASAPSQLSSFFDQVLSQAFGIFAHGSAIAIFLTPVLAVLFGSLFFSLLETCFDVIYHLPPRPFLRRHLVAIVMLFLFLALTLISIVVLNAPSFFLSLLHIVQPGDTPESNLILHLAGIVGSILVSMITFEAVYAMIPHRHITFRTLGRHMRNSWRGAAMATVVTQLFLLLFPLYSIYFLGSSIGQVAFIAILLVFVYVSQLILLLGAEVNAFFAEGIRVPKNDLITQASRDEYR
jgi:uncharacterized BrkB/YihY/UPF0761 family membrane protein/membrane-associated phospholipid phosphatase